MKKAAIKLFGLTLVLVFSLIFSPAVKGVQKCCSTDECMTALCKDDPNCSSTCQGNGVGCKPPGTCYTTYSTSLQCDDTPWGVCIDGCQTRTCEECYGGDIGCLDVLNIQGCDGMVCGRTTDAPGSCHPASVPPPAPACDQTGLLHKYLIYEGALLLL